MLDGIQKSLAGDNWHICGTCPCFTTFVDCGVWECIGLFRGKVKGGIKKKRKNYDTKTSLKISVRFMIK